MWRSACNRLAAHPATRTLVIPSTTAVMASTTAVIASVAKQSMVGADTLHGLLRYARNDGGGTRHDNSRHRLRISLRNQHFHPKKSACHSLFTKNLF